MRKSFTLVELIFVIVVLSIISVISAQILTKIYEQYLMTRAINELETKTELILTKIANILQYRVKESTIARRLPPNENNITALPMADENYQILEWISYDNDSFRGLWHNTKNLYVPGWSGFIDLENSNTNKSQIKTSGSNLNYANSIISHLSNGNATLNNGKVAIIFKGLPIGFDIEEYGWNDWNGTIKHSYIHKVKCPTSGCSDILEFVDIPAERDIAEQYYLSWTAYAVVPDDNSSDTNLRLYYNYRPWEGDKYSDGTNSLLAQHVSVFKFRQIDQVIRLKLCLNKSITNDFNVSFCKEKVVY